MNRDALNRRNRFAGRQPTGKRIELGERDFQYFMALERHGPLPANYLYEFTRATARNHKGHQQRLTDLYNEDNTPHYGWYLERPEQQFASLNARYQPMTYEITDLAVGALRDNGTPAQRFVALGGPYLHRFMTACLSASIELAVQKSGFRFISQAEILRHAKCPDATRRAANPLALPSGGATLVPDQLFGIDYGGQYRFFVLEADRKTETISSRSNARAFGRKLEAYASILKNEAYKRVWGVPTLNILVVTTSVPHLRTTVGHLAAAVDATTAARFLFKAKPSFGKYWIVPPVMLDMLSEPWERVTAALDIGRP